jgi:predicted nucleic acid-binding protein
VVGRGDLLVSDLAVTEAVSALARRLLQGDITPGIARRIQQVLIARLEDGSFQRVELSREVHRRGEHFLLSQTRSPLRAADALHLALATSARAACVASFDARLRAAAQTVGLATYPA